MSQMIQYKEDKWCSGGDFGLALVVCQFSESCELKKKMYNFRLSVYIRDVAIYSWLVRQKLSANGANGSAVDAKPS